MEVLQHEHSLILNILLSAIVVAVCNVAMHGYVLHCLSEIRRKQNDLDHRLEVLYRIARWNSSTPQEPKQ